MSEPVVKDPSKSFRGVMAAVLIIEAIVVALALPVVAKLGGGFADGSGWIVLGLVVGLVLACAMLGRSWSIHLALVLQVVMIACGFFVFALGVLGVAFGLIWGLMLWMRQDVARRYAEGSLPAQQAAREEEQ